MKKNNSNEFNIEKVSKKVDPKSIAFWISITLFVILTIAILTNIINPIDSSVESFIMDIRNDKLTRFMTSLTNIGGAYCLTAISILLLIIIKKKKIPLYIIINLILAFGTNEILKLLLRRSRPTGEFLINETGYSYPSGHAMVSMAYFTFLTYLICKKSKNKILNSILIILTIILILAIGFSRIYLGVHYVSDIIGSYIITIAYSVIFAKLIYKKEKK